MRKMQTMLLGKLITVGLVIPAANVSRGKVHRSLSKKMMSKLAMLHGLALIVAPSLPLTVPLSLLTMTASCETFMAAVRYSHQRDRRSLGDAAPPVPKEGLVLAVISSNLFHAAFVSCSGAALLFLVLPWAGWLAARLLSATRRSI